MGRHRATAALLAALAPAPALAAPFSCGSFAQAGAAEILCSHTEPAAPAQVCTYSWTLTGAAGGPAVVQGSFLLSPGQQNLVVYQGTSAGPALGPPVVLCQGRRADG